MNRRLCQPPATNRDRPIMTEKIEQSCSPVPDGVSPTPNKSATKSTHCFSRRRRRTAGPVVLLHLALAWFASGDLRAEPGYTAQSGKIAFIVGSNVPLLKVTGSSTAITGQGEGTVNGETATVLNLRFEVDPATFKSGMKLRDQHMYEKVFTASDGSMPRIILQAGRVQAELNSQTSKWEGELKGQLTMRGVTRPISFRATAEKKGDSAVVSARGTLKTSDFGVKPIGYAGAKVEDEVAVTVSDVVMKPSSRK